MTLWERFKRYDNYRKAVVVALPFSAGLLLYLFSIGAEELFLSEWFISVISIPNFFAFQFGTAAYIGGLLDNYNNNKRKQEVRGTLLGLILGLTLGIWLATIHFAVPFASTLLLGANILFLFRQMNIFAGLGNRIGRMMDKDSRPEIEKKIVGSSIAMSFMLGVILVATASAGAIGLAGVTTFIMAGSAIPIWLASALFVITLTSGIGSTADYIAKAVNFLKTQHNRDSKDKNDIKNNKFVNDRYHEYRGSLMGVSTGLIAGGITLSMLMITQPYLFVGPVGAVMGLLILTTAASLFGSTFSRMARLWDKLPEKSQPPAPSKSTYTKEVRVLISPTSPRATNDKVLTKEQHAKADKLIADTARMYRKAVPGVEQTNTPSPIPIPVLSAK